jgi:hypothetical protein
LLPRALLLLLLPRILLSRVLLLLLAGLLLLALVPVLVVHGGLLSLRTDAGKRLTLGQGVFPKR